MKIQSGIYLGSDLFTLHTSNHYESLPQYCLISFDIYYLKAYDIYLGKRKGQEDEIENKLNLIRVQP